ncbi:Hemolysin-type calcium-binding repeat-containing protein [Streptomyces zhaozhouensis]|uniref:Hemolysin-type calcium-binding repeat-containing protein n=1 Tax=Streptomyces zhaozhouensis TaxID=1300267 RepID=A0A286DXX5_9ACTN|nr:calcium-binding protein [Streptomyces zhaozhouensis]SOD63486.1 Hemolysin-type calcium-binding repeat-containing protein [Streptomyces zhaozhouensis]
MKRSRLIPSTVLLALVTAGLGAAPATADEGAAGGATVGADWEGHTLRIVYEGGPEANDLHVFSMDTGDEVRRVGFVDAVPITAGEHCAYPEPDNELFVACELPVGDARTDDVRVLLGDGDDDVVTSEPGVTMVRGGAGDDELHAHTAELVFGDDGDDMLMGYGALFGGAGDDHLMGQPIDEVLHGGPGDDMIEGWDGDDVVYGGTGDDHISGGEGDDVLFGGPGNDHITGDGGDDLIVGWPGDDHVEQ